MDLVEQKKLVEQLLLEPGTLTPELTLGGKPLSLTACWGFKREFTFKNPTFWKYLIQLSNEFFLAQFKDKHSLDKSFRCVFGKATLLPTSLLRAKFCSIKNLFDTVFTRLVRTQTEYRKYIQHLSPSQLHNSCTGPPKGFVPLPDIETGGCARNDILTALASN